MILCGCNTVPPPLHHQPAEKKSLYSEVTNTQNGMYWNILFLRYIGTLINRTKIIAMFFLLDNLPQNEKGRPMDNVMAPKSPTAPHEHDAHNASNPSEEFIYTLGIIDDFIRCLAVLVFNVDVRYFEKSYVKTLSFVYNIGPTIATPTMDDAHIPDGPCLIFPSLCTSGAKYDAEKALPIAVEVC